MLQCLETYRPVCLEDDDTKTACDELVSLGRFLSRNVFSIIKPCGEPFVVLWSEACFRILVVVCEIHGYVIVQFFVEGLQQG